MGKHFTMCAGCCNWYIKKDCYRFSGNSKDLVFLIVTVSLLNAILFWGSPWDETIIKCTKMMVVRLPLIFYIGFTTWPYMNFIHHDNMQYTLYDGPNDIMMDHSHLMITFNAIVPITSTFSDSSKIGPCKYEVFFSRHIKNIQILYISLNFDRFFTV